MYFGYKSSISQVYILRISWVYFLHILWIPHGYLGYILEISWVNLLVDSLSIAELGTAQPQLVSTLFIKDGII